MQTLTINNKEVQVSKETINKFKLYSNNIHILGELEANSRYEMFLRNLAIDNGINGNEYYQVWSLLGISAQELNEIFDEL